MFRRWMQHSHIFPFLQKALLPITTRVQSVKLDKNPEEYVQSEHLRSEYICIPVDGQLQLALVSIVIFS